MRVVALALALLCGAALSAECGVLFSTLPRTLGVESRIQGPAKVARAGEDHLVVRWWLDASARGADEGYVEVQVKLCYSAESQRDRGWRKRKDDLHKDKSCPKQMGRARYAAAGGDLVWRVGKDVAGASYFVRAYALGSNGSEVAYGQTTNAARNSNLFAVEPITGRHASMDVAAAIFSAFSVGALIFFLSLEQLRSRRKNAQKS